MYSLTKRATIAFGRATAQAVTQPMPIAARTGLSTVLPTITQVAAPAAGLTTGGILQRALQPLHTRIRTVRRQIRYYKVESAVHLSRVVKVMEVDGSGWVSLSPKYTAHSAIQAAISPGASVAA
jgi:hypothetical protein